VRAVHDHVIIDVSIDGASAYGHLTSVSFRTADVLMPVVAHRPYDRSESAAKRAPGVRETLNQRARSLASRASSTLPRTASTLVAVTARDYSSISPSARALVAMRARTDLPFARRAGELVWGAEGLAAEHARLAALPGSDLRLMHFVQRYRDIDAALEECGATRILELGAGLSCRGLDLASRKTVTYVETDLPAITETKRDLIAALTPTVSDGSQPLVGELRVRALDAMDPAAFAAAVDELPPGDIAIVNEGLLMYLGDEEKARLAANIRAALIRRGGVWITADIYLRVPGRPELGVDDRLKSFLTSHNVDENKFADRVAAEAFFTSSGFAIRRRLSTGSHAIRETWLVEPA
jgi:O-methyltransferase involved in polyketide biosynthesis